MKTFSPNRKQEFEYIEKVCLMAENGVQSLSRMSWFLHPSEVFTKQPVETLEGPPNWCCQTRAASGDISGGKTVESLQ